MTEQLVHDVFDAYRLAVDTAKVEIRVALPAAALDFDRGASRVKAQVMVRRTLKNLQPFDEPAMQGLPVIHPGGGGYVFAFDLRAADLGVVVACDGPPRGVYETGQAVTPGLGQGHDYGCGLFVPGGRVSAEEAPTPPVNDAGTAWVGAVDGSAGLSVRGAGLPSPAETGSVVLAAAGPTASVLLGGATATDPVACATEVAANLAALNTLVQAWVPVPNDGGASLKAVILAWFNNLQDMADAKARVEGPPKL